MAPHAPCGLELVRLCVGDSMGLAGRLVSATVFVPQKSGYMNIKLLHKGFANLGCYGARSETFA